MTTGSYEVAVKDIVIVPLLNGRPGISIKQPEFTDRIYVENTGGGGDVTGPGCAVYSRDGIGSRR